MNNHFHGYSLAHSTDGFAARARVPHGLDINVTLSWIWYSFMREDSYGTTSWKERCGSRCSLPRGTVRFPYTSTRRCGSTQYSLRPSFSFLHGVVRYYKQFERRMRIYICDVLPSADTSLEKEKDEPNTRNHLFPRESQLFRLGHADE